MILGQTLIFVMKTGSRKRMGQRVDGRRVEGVLEARGESDRL
jgi:hypothetical protein